MDPRTGRQSTSKVHFGIHSINEHDLPVDAADLTAELTAALQAPSYSPPLLPTAAVKVLEMANAKDASPRALVAFFEEDPFLAGRVLKVARSASFVSNPGNVRTLQDAVVRLGVKTVRDIVLELSLSSKIFRVPAYAPVLESLRRHASAVARITKIVCRQCGLSGDDAFVVGLFHDIGTAAALYLLGERGHDCPPILNAWPALMEVHELAGGLVARAWKLPQEVCSVVASHHSFPADLTTGGLSAAVFLADALATELGAPPAPNADLLEPRSELMLSRARELLGIDAEIDVTLRRQAAEALASAAE